jgi:hypothetical protein
VELKLTSMEGVAEPGDELAAEDAAEHADGQKEVSSDGDPTGVVRSETGGGNYAVGVRMMLQALIPAMQRADETDLGSQTSTMSNPSSFLPLSVRIRFGHTAPGWGNSAQPSKLSCGAGHRILDDDRVSRCSIRKYRTPALSDPGLKETPTLSEIVAEPRSL